MATRNYLVIALMSAGLLGALWAVRAQERQPIWAPPLVLEPDAPPASMPVPVNKQKKPIAVPQFPAVSQPGQKQAVAPDAFDVPRPTAVRGLVVEEPGRIVQAGAVQPPPMFPPLPIDPPRKDEKSTDQPPLPPLLLGNDDAKIPVIKADPAPLPLPEPTKVLIKDPPRNDPPGSLVPPLLMPDVHRQTPIAEPERVKSFIRKRPGDLPPPVPTIDGGKSPLSVDSFRGAASGSPQGGLLNLQAPHVRVEKRGQALLRAGVAQTFQLIVRNFGPSPAAQVRIEDELPPGVQLVSAEPAPATAGTKLHWILTNLKAQDETLLRLVLRASADIELTQRVQLQVSAYSETRTVALRPRPDTGALTLSVSGPAQVSLGQPLVLELHVANQSSEPIKGVKLYGNLPEGLNTPQGRDIEGPEEGMVFLAGEAKTLKMPATAVKPGRYDVRVKVASSTGIEATDSAVIDIRGNALFLEQPPTTRLTPGRDGDLVLEIINFTAKTLRHVQVANRLAEGLDFVAASDRGLYQANSRTVHWHIDQLAAGKSLTLRMRVHGVKTGRFVNQAFVRTEGFSDLQATGTIVVEGAAELSLRVQDRDNPLEMGRETVYEIQVQNPGSAATQNVQLQVQFPAGLVPRNAQGGTRHAIDGQFVRFEPLPELGPQGQAIYRVTALARGEGDQRVRFAVVSNEMRVPVQREVSTLVYRD